jgi:hypothetical protein
MKLIITEEQYKRLKKGDDCPFLVFFNFYEKGIKRQGTRKVCVDKEFWSELQEYLLHKFDESYEISEKLESMIKRYYFDTYYFSPDRTEIRYITQVDYPKIGVFYKPFSEKEIKGI